MKNELTLSPRRLKLLFVLCTVPMLLAFAWLASSFFTPTSSEAESPTGFSYPSPIGPDAVIFLNSTAYNSRKDQTNSDPFTTATGQTTRSGIVALSRDLLKKIPYGSYVEILDIRPREGNPNGCGATMLTVMRLETLPGSNPGQFRVEDTLHPRKENQLDMWLEHLEDAERWGVCEIVIRALEREPLFLAQGK